MNVDRPIPAKIIMTLSDKGSSGEDFISLSTDLLYGGLIFAEPRELRKTKNVLGLTVTFSSRFAFKNWLKNDRIKKQWTEKFASALSELPQTLPEKDVIIEVDNVFNCSCKASQIEFYLLAGRTMVFNHGLTCGNCLGLIPNHKIPENIKLENWLELYENVYSIWLQSGVLEKWASRELSNYKKGKLNLQGQKIRAELAEFFKKPVYYTYFEEEPDLNKVCLICGNEGIKSGLKRPNQVCGHCFTAFDYTH